MWKTLATRCMDGMDVMFIHEFLSRPSWTTRYTWCTFTMATCLYPFIFLSSLFVSCRFVVMRMPQLIFHHVLYNSISCQNVTSILLQPFDVRLVHLYQNWWVCPSSLDLRVVIKPCTLAFTCSHLLLLGLYLYCFLNLSAIFALGLALKCPCS